jgi:hypothetical protein
VFGTLAFAFASPRQPVDSSGSTCEAALPPPAAQPNAPEIDVSPASHTHNPQCSGGGAAGGQSGGGRLRPAVGGVPRSSLEGGQRRHRTAQLAQDTVGRAEEERVLAADWDEVEPLSGGAHRAGVGVQLLLEHRGQSREDIAAQDKIPLSGVSD